MRNSAAGGVTPLRLLAEAAFLAVLAVGVLLDSRSYPASLAEGAPGPAFFPRLLATLLIVCAVWLAVRGRPWSHPPELPPESPPEPPLEPQPDLRRSRGNVFSGSGAGRGARLWLAVGWIAAFLLVWSRLGTVVSVPLLVVGLMWLTGERSRAVLVTVPLAFAGFIYLVFMVALGVPLPAGF
ncbi:tripartite tricarboxylate transporter TctB family protein [Candidatus Palauibacter sp.]|uniref:tripartite tricarboxylate transporter TctB family protein n=1 Tax=Candidatus Palauibacter sp. TaxID=3101350 RepID=UPI003AF200A8